MSDVIRHGGGYTLRSPAYWMPIEWATWDDYQAIPTGMPPDVWATHHGHTAQMRQSAFGVHALHCTDCRFWWSETSTEDPVTPTIGRIVHYTLSEQDAEAINRRRADFAEFQRSHAHPHEPGQPGATGHQAHVGNHASAGQTFPADVVRTFGGDAANLQVKLDGNDTYWATSRCEGEPGEHGKWVWPPRA